IELRHNSITTLEPKAFTNFTELGYLGLSYNDINIIHDSTFAGLHKLQTLYLDNNNISIIHDNTFAGLHKLQNLFLNNNQLTDFPNFDPDFELSIANNSWICDCRFSWLRLSNDNLVCASPSKYAGKPLNEIPLEDYCPGEF
ncbi:hypothetical protein CAPTEDRAFT_76694, partial [Capitella teleta]